MVLVRPLRSQCQSRMLWRMEDHSMWAIVGGVVGAREKERGVEGESVSVSELGVDGVSVFEDESEEFEFESDEEKGGDEKVVEEDENEPEAGCKNGASIFVNNTTSLNATVIPPPVNGCLIFHESPINITPSFDPC